jgi:penicillin-binding protein 1A
MPRTPRSAPPAHIDPRARAIDPRARTTDPRARTTDPRARTTAPLRRAAAPLRSPPAPPPAHPPIPRRGFRWLRWTIMGVVWGAVALALVVLWFARDLPRPESALDATRRPALTLQDRSGHVFARFGDVVGDPLHLADMPPYLTEAVVAVEDRRFWHHPGIDVIGMARAAWTDLMAGQVVQGGSTLTQQVAKNLFLSDARTLRRKVQEFLLTLWLEQHFSKREILEIYLNRVYLGAGAWGMDAAAHVYFGVSARHVTLWQAAVLAGLPRAPSRFNPRIDPAAAAARAKEVLAAMVETGAITEAQAQAAAAAIAFPPAPAIAAGWFADWAAAQAAPELSPNADATLHTTLDARLQGVAEARLAALLDGPGAAAGVSQGAVVVLDAATGAVRAMVGGRDYRSGSFNRAVEARRQPGSAFKPFTWLSALQKGLSPDSTVLDAPIHIGRWSPENFEHRYLGEITLTQALAQSINTAAVRLLLRAGGPRAVAATAARLGIADKLPDNASLALGTGEVGLLELSAAYAPFFNGGYRVTPFGVETYAAANPPVSVIDPVHAAMMARMLTAVVTGGTGRPAAVAGRQVAGKTGTTQDFRDAWFIGCVDGTIIGVWLGNDDGRPMRGVMGGGLPALLFHQVAVSVR